MRTLTIGTRKIIIKDEWRTAFFATWIAGLLAHAYRFFNFLPIWDSLYNFVGIGSTYNLGRWFLPQAGKISSMFDMPWVNGALSLFYISVAVILLTEIFGLKSRLTIALSAALFVSFPTVIATFAYMYTADAYMLAFLLSVLAIYLPWRIGKSVPGTLAGIVCLAFSMGIYQAYASVTAVLALLLVLRQFVIEGKGFGEAVREDVKYLAVLACGAILYYVIAKLYLLYYHIGFSGYQGMSEMGIMSLGEYKAAAIKSITRFRFILGLKDSSASQPYTLLNAAVLALLAISLVYMAARNRVYRKPLPLLASAAALFLIPFAAYLIYFASPGVEYHTLMEMACCLVYLLLLTLLEHLDRGARLPRAVKGCGIAVLCGLVYYNVINCNIAYWNMNLSYQKTFSIAEDVLQRIEQMDEFTNTKDKVIISGDYNCPTEGIYSMVPVVMGVSNDSILNDSAHYINIWRYCFGVELTEASYEELMATLDSEEYKSMPAYPLAGCVDDIDGIIVVKMAE